LKVILLTSTGAWGGTEVHALKFAGTLAKRGHEVQVIGLDQDLYRDPCLRARPRIGYQRLHLARPVRDVSYWGWRAQFRTLRADVCVLVKNCFLAGSVALDLAARHSFPSFFTIEQLAGDPFPAKSSSRYLGGLIPGLGLWWYRRRVGHYLRSVGPRRIVCVSDAVRNRLVRDYRFPARKAVTIHNGIDPERFQPSGEHRSATRRAWGIPEDALVFGAVGRLDNLHKGYEVAVELFAELTRMLPSRDLRLVLVGEGPDGPSLKALAARLGVAHLVCFPGFTSRSWEVYPALDIFVMPSRMEGLPHALAEAMACGCCPIAMGVGGVPEVIPNPGLGWLVAPEDREGFFTAMTTAARCGPEERRQMGRRAREYVASKFNEKFQLGTLADLIEAS
jgi:glycosyltransferase involved in cell wall biosynthesis